MRNNQDDIISDGIWFEKNQSPLSEYKKTILYGLAGIYIGLSNEEIVELWEKQPSFEKLYEY